MIDKGMPSPEDERGFSARRSLFDPPWGISSTGLSYGDMVAGKIPLLNKRIPATKGIDVSPIFRGTGRGVEMTPVMADLVTPDIHFKTEVKPGEYAIVPIEGVVGIFLGDLTKDDPLMKRLIGVRMVADEMYATNYGGNHEIQMDTQHPLAIGVAPDSKNEIFYTLLLPPYVRDAGVSDRHCVFAVMNPFTGDGPNYILVEALSPGTYIQKLDQSE